MSELVVLSHFMGHIRLVSTQRRDDDALVLGGYAIYYDSTGLATGRTPDTDTVRLIFE